jgi:hypothetical protein
MGADLIRAVVHVLDKLDLRYLVPASRQEHSMHAHPPRSTGRTGRTAPILFVFSKRRRRRHIETTAERAAVPVTQVTLQHSEAAPTDGLHA